MADDVLEDAGPSPDAGKVKREPPTIDLEATKVSEAAKASDKACDKASDKPAETPSAPQPETPAEPSRDSVKSAPGSSRPISPWLTAPISGVIGAAIVIAVGWLAGWSTQQAPPAAPQVSVAYVDALGRRVAELESKPAKAPAPVTDPAVTARLDTLEKGQGALRSDLATLHAQADKLAAAASSAKSAPSDSAGAAPAPTVDLSAINERIDQIEREVRAQDAAIAKAGEQPPAKAQDDLPLRRVVAAALLDVAVRHGDHFARQLDAAKALASDPARLKPLDDFADKGVPNPNAMCRELLTLVPKLSPAPETPTTGSGVIDRLKAGASNLVRIERTDAVGNDRGAVVTRATAAALRNDYAEARREIASLDAADRAPAQAWLDKAAAREAALAASRQFAEETMAALAKSAQ